MSYRLYKPSYKSKSNERREVTKWYIEFVDHNETVRRLPAFASKAASEELGRGLVKLVEFSKASGGQTDPSLIRWLTTLPVAMREKLASIGLLDTERAAISKPLADHLDDWGVALTSQGTSARHVKLVTGRARRVFEG